jgi:hypothetical protein
MLNVAWLALLLYLVGLALAFGWRTLAQWRRTGDTGLRLDAGRPGALRWWAIGHPDGAVTGIVQVLHGRPPSSAGLAARLGCSTVAHGAGRHLRLPGERASYQDTRSLSGFAIDHSADVPDLAVAFRAAYPSQPAE